MPSALSQDTRTELSGILTIITGVHGVGKTTLCHKLGAEARARGYTCAGLVTLRYPTNTLEVIDLRSEEHRQLTTSPDTAHAVTQGRFCFDPLTIAWGNEKLTCSVPTHLLVVDELGPLELDRGQGWTAAFDILRQARYSLALVVIRPTLVARAQLALPFASRPVLTVTPQNRDLLLEMLLAALAEASHPLPSGSR